MSTTVEITTDGRIILRQSQPDPDSPLGEGSPMQIVLTAFEAVALAGQLRAAANQPFLPKLRPESPGLQPWGMKGRGVAVLETPTKIPWSLARRSHGRASPGRRRPMGTGR
jgi:hypothetical protein